MDANAPRKRTAVCEPSADAAYEAFLCDLLRDHPHVCREDSPVQLTRAGEPRWLIAATDLHILLEARRFLLARAKDSDV